MVNVALVVIFRMCKLCPWLKAFELPVEFGFRLIVAPTRAMSLSPQNFIQPLRVPGINCSKRGVVRGKAFDKDDLNWQFGHDRNYTREISRYAILISAVLAAAAFLWARRVTFLPARAWSWAAFVLAFGIPGFITFLLAADWPCFVSCPRCRQARPVEKEMCPHCGSGWPEPAANGAEILEPAASETPEPASV